MRTIFAMLLLAAAAALAATPAAAMCVEQDGTGTSACADLQGVSRHAIHVSQSGIGSAGAHGGESGSSGSTFRGSGAFVATAYDSPVGSNGALLDRYCIDEGGDGACELQGNSASLWSSGGGLLPSHLLVDQTCGQLDADASCEHDRVHAGGALGQSGYALSWSCIDTSGRGGCDEHSLGAGASDRATGSNRLSASSGGSGRTVCFYSETAGHAGCRLLP